MASNNSSNSNCNSSLWYASVTAVATQHKISPMTATAREGEKEGGRDQRLAIIRWLQNGTVGVCG